MAGLRSQSLQQGIKGLAYHFQGLHSHLLGMRMRGPQDSINTPQKKGNKQIVEEESQSIKAVRKAGGQKMRSQFSNCRQ